MATKTITNEEYDKKIAEFGVVKRLENYINNHTPINHYCLIHKKTYPGYPANILKGGGLKCCAIASIKAQSNLRKSKAKNELIERGFIAVSRQGGRNKCSLYAVTWQPIDDCKGKLDIGASNKPLNLWKGWKASPKKGSK